MSQHDSWSSTQSTLISPAFVLALLAGVGAALAQEAMPNAELPPQREASQTTCRTRIPAFPWLAAPAIMPEPLDVKLTVKENAGVGATGYPVSVVIPLPQGLFRRTTALGLSRTPSQVEALERWPDGSLRHVMVHFQSTIAANGSTIYHLNDCGQIAPPKPVSVTVSGAEVAVVTGPLRFTVSRTAFNILDQVWLDSNGNGVFESSEQIIASHAQNGGVFIPRAGAGAIQYDTARQGLEVKVEEYGPLRAVIRVEAPARFISATDHTHGFAVRIYAYAGKPFIKVDYQLQNSDKTVVRSWPLYFEALNIDFRLGLSVPSILRFGLGDGSVFSVGNTSGAFLAQEMHNNFKIRNLQTGAILHNSGLLSNGNGPDGFVDVSDTARGVMAAVRNLWQTWPNGLAVDGANRLSLQLFPAWSAQWHNKQISPSGLYWLEDMQHVYKEALLYFHAASVSDTALVNLARTFQFPPVVVLPTEWHRQTRATLDLGGVIPPASSIPATDDLRRPAYMSRGFDPEDWYDPTGDFYGAGWINFYDPEPGYRSAACEPGGWPYSGADFIATSNPADYFTAEGWAQSELNLRPEWMTGYTHNADWRRLQLTDNPYCGGRWRIFEGNAVSKLAALPLPGTGSEEPVYFSRDDQHGWFYHVAEAYWLTGNPWIRDWYGFIAQFRQTRLQRLDPFPDTSSRATGHALSHVLQAYRVTGDAGLLRDLGQHIRAYLRPEQDSRYGDQMLSVEDSGGGFQTGYLMRFVVNYLEEVRAAGDWQAYAEAFNYLSGLMEWNCNFGNFPYYFDARAGGRGVSSGTSLTLVDPQAWYYWRTGRQKYLDQINAYMTTGINVGENPYGEFNQWTGQFEGRYYLYVKNNARSDKIPPPAIADLSAAMGKGTITLAWTAPVDAVRYHIVWSTKPIVEAISTDSAVTNWWAAAAIGPSLAPVPGARQTLSISTGSANPIYAAVFSFDAFDNMSAMSNVTQAK